MGGEGGLAMQQGLGRDETQAEMVRVRVRGGGVAG